MYISELEDDIAEARELLSEESYAFATEVLPLFTQEQRNDVMLSIGCGSPEWAFVIAIGHLSPRSESIPAAAMAEIVRWAEADAEWLGEKIMTTVKKMKHASVSNDRF